MRRSLLVLIVVVTGCATADSHPAEPAAEPVYGAAPWNQPGAVIPEEAWAPIDLPPAAPHRLLISKSVLLEGNEALVVDDPEVVRGMFDLLRGNSVVAHTCAYHWNLIFEIADQQFASVPFNQECEQFRRSNAEIQRLVRGYTTRIERQPSQYLIEVAFAPEEDVAAALKRVAEAGDPVFLLDPEWARFPRVRIEAAAAGPATPDGDVPPEVEARAKQRVEEALRLLQQRGHSLRSFEVGQSGVSYQGNRVVYAAKADVVLSRTFKPDDVQSYPAHISFCEYFVPKDYSIYVVTGVQLSPALEQRLRALAPTARRIAAAGMAREYDPDSVKNLRCPLFIDLEE